MKNKQLIRWLCLLLLVVAIAGVTMVSAMPRPGAWKEEPKPDSEGLVLEDMPIVLPANATEVEKTAAKELQHYLREITGSASSMITENVPVDSAIYLGATKFAKENNVTYTDKNGMGEGWAIKAVGNSLVITGGEARGTLYAVYHLLEDVLGVHWWNMWEEYVPTMEDAVLPFEFELSGEPVFADRAIYSDETIKTLYYVRNRANGWTANAPQAFGGEEGFTRPYNNHTFNKYYPPYYTEPTSASAAKWYDLMNPDGIDYFVEHPEWYAWSDTRQARISFGQLCLTNEELIEDFKDKLIKCIELSYQDADTQGIDRPSYIDITPNDLGGHCECDVCQASIAASGPSGHLLKFVNKLANHIYEKYPEMTVETLAYAAYFETPLDGTVPADNVVIRLASNDVSIFGDMDDAINAQVKERLEAWGSILKPGQLWYWDYGIAFGSIGVVPNLFKFGPDWQKLYEAGGTRIFMEQEQFNSTDFWDMKHWVWTKLMEDPYQDQMALAETFAKGYYGEDAADEIMEWLLLIDQEADAVNQTTQIRYSTKYIDIDWLSAQSIKKGHLLFEKAVAETEANPDLTAEEKELLVNRINFARVCLDTQILSKYTQYVNEMAETGELLDIGKRETGLRMIGALEWAMDMELEEDHTGVNKIVKRGKLDGTAKNQIAIYGQYTSEKDPNSGEYQERPPIPEQIYEDHPGISDRHIYDYTDTTFWDAGSYYGYGFAYWMNSYYGEASYEGGSAVVWDIGKMVERDGIDGQMDANQKYYYTFSETKSIPGPVFAGTYLNDPILADGEYHLYRMEDRVLITEGSATFSLFASTMTFDLKELEHLLNTPVDVYVSMKIEGDPTGEDPNNYAKIWVDRVIIVEDCTAHQVEYTSVIPATCSSNAFKVGICPICGQDAKKEVLGTRLNHTFSTDYTYDAATNTYSNTCLVCGEVEFSNLKAELPDDVLASLMAEGTDLGRIYDYGWRDLTIVTFPDIAEIVQDPDSDLGEAIYWHVAAAGEVYSYFAITDKQGLRVALNAVPNPPMKKDIITDGQYHIYKMEDVDLFPSNHPGLVFFDNTLELNTTPLSHLKGKKVDLYVSFKVVGDLDFSSYEVMPDYYIDRIIIAENCREHYSENMTYDAAEKAYMGSCDYCGNAIRYDVLGELPQEILDAVKAADSSLAHVYDFGIDTFHDGYTQAGYLDIVEDEASSLGRAVRYNTAKTDAGSRGNYFTFSGDSQFTLKHLLWEQTCEPLTGISGEELNANSGDGKYHLYKLSGVLLPDHLNFLWTFDWHIQYPFSELKAYMANLPVDVYVSMKVQGDVTCTNNRKFPKYWLDRIIVVDNCANHMNMEEAEKLSDATCYQGEVWNGQCLLCGKVLEAERKDTQKEHNFGEYKQDPVTGDLIASCRNSGCTEYKSITSKGEVPQVILDDLAASGTGLAHVYDYTVDNFRMAPPPFEKKADPDSLVGMAAVGDAWGNLSLFDPSVLILKPDEVFYLKLYRGSHPATEFVIGGLTYDMLNPNENMGYQVYKFEDVTIPNVDFDFFYMFNSEIQCDKMARDVAKLKGKSVDFYISLKIEGDLDNSMTNVPGLVFYLDRIVMVDSCDDYDLDYKLPDGASCADGTAILTATCPVCGREKTKEGSAGAHEFGWYYRVKGTTYDYRAECIHGCGAVDYRYDPKLTMEEKLPDDLPASAREHLIISYTCDEFILSGEELYGYRWDHDLGRPVAVREYDPTKSAEMQFGYNTANGINLSMYGPGRPSEQISSFSGAEIRANAGDGKYHLYAMKGIVPIKYNSYEYMFMFSDWVLQCWMFDDDLLARGYKDKAIDVYLRMKVDGDPSCAGAEKPIYYIDQIIVTEACTIDEWVVTREATCSQMGEMTGTCTVCGLEGATVGIPKVAHTLKDPLISKQPTCTTNAFEIGNCTVCGASFTQQEVPGTKLEHSFSNYVKQEDGSGTEIAYCDNGCGERHIREAVNSTPNFGSDSLIGHLPAIGGGSSHGVSFSDIKSSDWYFGAVKNAMSNKLINGVTATEFRPNETLTTAQAIKLAAAYHERSETGEVTLTNGSGNWYSSYVDYAVENGIVESEYASMSAAEMNKPIERSEFVAIFAAAMGEDELKADNTVADNAIPDVQMDDENAEDIYAFYRAGILTGSDTKGTFNPHTPIKRSEVATILNRMFDEEYRQTVTLH